VLAGTDQGFVVRLQLYSDSIRTVTTTTPLDSSRFLNTTETYDERGRLILAKTPNATCGQASVEHRYLTPNSTDTTNYGYSYELVSNPYCTTSDPGTMGWTRTKRDTSGRVIEVASYSGGTAPAPWATSTSLTGATLTDYSLGDRVKVTDPQLKARRTRVDGLGRMVEVVEDPDVLAYSTTYGYDLRDSLISVAQTRKAPSVADVPQNRTFHYDSLGRLKDATNVESGATSYTYDDNGNLQTTQIAGGTTRTFAYNTRNQITSKKYPATTTPPAIYCYDGLVPNSASSACVTPTAPTPSPIAGSAGRLTGVGSSAAITNYTGFDWLGRVLSSEQWVDGQRYGFAYQYLLGGQLSSLQYPSLHSVSYTFNDAGQTVSASNGSTSYASAMNYAPYGAIASGTFGPLTQSFTYNDHLQLGTITAKRWRPRCGR
jgi:YD repeat-containing protein